jgi:drug/metabolite transporter (DMT)-like permease
MSEARAVPWQGALCGLAAAALFGVSTPLAKWLLPDTGPLLLASLFYLGAGAGLIVPIAWRRIQGSTPEAALRRADLRWILTLIGLGGIAAPVLMLFGLERVSGVTGALLLNLESPFTVLLAVLLFGEHLSKRATAAATTIVGGAVVLALGPGEIRLDPLGGASIALACACWAIDNNATQRLSLRDPFRIACLKATSAGACALLLALGLGDALPSLRVLLAALVVGVFSYGVSIVLDVYALRILGAAREAAFFATAPFLGALASVPLLGEPLRLWDLLAALFMGGGVVLLLRERHGHLHVHDALEHDHVHVHDEHHQHPHDLPGPFVEPHAHAHRHAPLVHEHPHLPDLHHRHPHRT